MRKPSILVSYTGPSASTTSHDIFFVLRPETNGICGEQALLSTIHDEPHYNKYIKLVYFANIPYEYFVKHQLFNSYYRVKIRFAQQGKNAFTKSMQEQFSTYFGVDFKSAKILGSYAAMNYLKCSSSELFKTWVASEDNLCIYNNTIKKIRDCYVVNYDIPQLIKSKGGKTDFAVMAFRIDLPYSYINKLSEQIYHLLCESKDISSSHKAQPHYFHHSKSSLEELWDGMHYAFHQDGSAISVLETTFGNILHQHGLSEKSIVNLVSHPIISHPLSKNGSVSNEVSLFEITQQKDALEAIDILSDLQLI